MLQPISYIDRPEYTLLFLSNLSPFFFIHILDLNPYSLTGHRRSSGQITYWALLTVLVLYVEIVSPTPKHQAEELGSYYNKYNGNVTILVQLPFLKYREIIYVVNNEQYTIRIYLSIKLPLK